MFCVARCYRTEWPQRGCYRELTQVGIELLGGRAREDRAEVEALLVAILDELGVTYELARDVRRSLELSALGAQVAEGIGWAIGLDRLLLAMER